jgi:hypothetical protein
MLSPGQALSRQDKEQRAARPLQAPRKLASALTTGEPDSSLSCAMIGNTLWDAGKRLDLSRPAEVRRERRALILVVQVDALIRMALNVISELLLSHFLVASIVGFRSEIVRRPRTENHKRPLQITHHRSRARRERAAVELAVLPSVRRHVFSRPNLAELFVITIGLKVAAFGARWIHDLRLKSKVVPARPLAERLEGQLFWLQDRRDTRAELDISKRCRAGTANIPTGASTEAPNPINRCKQTLVAPSEIDRFRQTYVYYTRSPRNETATTSP